MSVKTNDMECRPVNRCRIPLATCVNANRWKSPSAPAQRVKFGSEMEPIVIKNKQPVSQLRQPVYKPPVPRSTTTDRPLSARSCKSQKSPGKLTSGSTRGSLRADTRSLRSPQRPAAGRPNTPMQQKRKSGSPSYGLPPQEVIRLREDQELLRDSFDISQVLQEISDAEKLPDNVSELQSSFSNKLNQFEMLKKELEVRQKTVLEIFASLKNTQIKLSTMGEAPELPSVDDLQVMNITKVSPDQLLQLCATRSSKISASFSKENQLLNMKTFYETPTKLILTCEQMLKKRQEVIDWFDKLKEQHGISMNKFSRKISEFNAENETLSNKIKAVKSEFLNKLNEIVDHLRRNQSQLMALQVQSEEMNYEISELNSQNADLRKQMQSASVFQSQHAKHRLEEIEKELKEEKSKKAVLKDRLTRTECQLKAASERAMQIEGALDQARSQNWSLERTIQQLNEQNRKLKTDFDTELNKLTESIKLNTTNLEEIAEDRKKLQTEKENLVKRIEELSKSYNESMFKMKEEIKTNTSQLIEAEKKYETEKESRLNTEKKLEKLCSQTLETELRCNEVLKTLQERDEQIAKASKKEAELEVTINKLNQANQEVEECKHQLSKQNETIREIEINFKEAIALEKTLKSYILEKEEYIEALEKKLEFVEQQMQENEQKMNSYVQQLNALKDHIEELQRDFGSFENLGQLHDMINEQRDHLNVVVKEKAELIEILQVKNAEIEQHTEHVSELENAIEEKDAEIKMLTKTEEEQSNIVEILRNNLEICAQADNKIRNQLAEKNAEVESLVSNLDTRKQQITELENIIITLEDQMRKDNFKRHKDLEKIALLEKALAEYEAYHMTAKQNTGNSVDNLDNLINILEDELGTNYELKLKDQAYRNIQRPKFIGDMGTDNNIIFQKGNKVPTKIVMGNYVKRTYLATNDEQQKVDNLDRKKAITQMETQKMMSALEPSVGGGGPTTKFSPTALFTMPPAYARDHLLLKNLQQLSNAHQLREDKKCKMFKLAGHKL